MYNSLLCYMLDTIIYDTSANFFKIKRTIKKFVNIKYVFKLNINFI
jgi:hypothetical protein